MLERPRTRAAQPTKPEISAADLMSRLYPFSDDSMGGRVLDSRGNSMGVEYIAREAARLGLLPAGDSGTYFQTVPLSYRTLDSTRAIALDRQLLTPWVDYIPRDQGDGARPFDEVPAIYGGTWGVATSLIPGEKAAGKLVVLTVAPAGYSQGIPGAVNRFAASARFPEAAGIAVAGLDLMPKELIPLYQNTGAAPISTSREVQPGFLYVTNGIAERLMGATLESLPVGTAGRFFTGSFGFVDRPLRYPGRNVVAVLPGSDPARKGEYLAIGAHNDHVGTAPQSYPHDSMYVVNHLYRMGGADDPTPRPTAAQFDTVNTILAEIRKQTGGKSARADSIYNGADDDGSGSMGVLELAEYFAAARVKPKRSLIFIWHVAEEAGLFGSEYFTDHPTVPRDSIVAQLNMDMIGRGASSDVTGSTREGGRLHGDSSYVQLVGSRRLSTELGTLAETVNAAAPHSLHFDYAMDANGHPQNIYCRSDHYEYARHGIPIIFFTTGGHADYHQLTDEPQYIDYARLARVTRFVADLAAAVGNLDHRVVVDQPKPNPQADCRQ